MGITTLAEFGVRRTITTKIFATDTNKKTVVRRGRPTEKWALVTGTKNLAVYNADKGGSVIEGSEYKAYARAQAVGKRAGLRLRAIPFSSAFYAL